MRPGVSVVVPSIPPRSELLVECLASVARQTYSPDAVIVVMDTDRSGAGLTRDRGLDKVDTEFVAFVDDDDLLDPSHIEKLVRCAERTGADLVYPWHHHLGETPDALAIPVDGVLVDPEGVPFGPEQAAYLRGTNFIPVTTLVRTELAQRVGGFGGEWCEDWRFLVRLLDADATFVHLPERTWSWRHHATTGNVPGNTSGLREKW